MSAWADLWLKNMQNKKPYEYTNEELREMLKELLDVDEGLSDKEIGFLDSLTSWIGKFTDNQADWLVNIYNRIFKIVHRMPNGKD